MQTMQTEGTAVGQFYFTQEISSLSTHFVLFTAATKIQVYHSSDLRSPRYKFHVSFVDNINEAF